MQRLKLLLLEPVPGGRDPEPAVAVVRALAAWCEGRWPGEDRCGLARLCRRGGGGGLAVGLCRLAAVRDALRLVLLEQEELKASIATTEEQLQAIGLAIKQITVAEEQLGLIQLH